MSAAAIDCGHTAIAYNSCRNRHCPKCQGRARAAWVAGAAGGAAAGSLFPCRLHPAGPGRRDRLPEQGGGLRHPVPRRRRDAARHRGRPAPPRRRDRRRRLVCTAGVRRCSTIRMSTASCRAAASRPTARAGSPADAGSSCRCRCSAACSGGSFSNLPPPSPTANCASSAISLGLSDPEPSPPTRGAAPDRLGGLRQAALRRPRAGAGLSRPLHPSRRHRQQPARSLSDGTVSFLWKDYRQDGRPRS